jgi:hypothetical protein
MRRTRDKFNTLDFPKTGGGEDIDFCIRVQQTVDKPLLSAPKACVAHPWWSKLFEAGPSPRRFFGWANGDSNLLDMYAEFRFMSWPAAWEIVAILSAWSFYSGGNLIASLGTCWLVDMLLDFYQKLFVDPQYQQLAALRMSWCSVLSSLMIANVYKLCNGAWAFCVPSVLRDSETCLSSIRLVATISCLP